eukprot:TRINITY_DN7910_c0_g1_i2.p1 TRINITY_DN7910_c0_g1~~TRINITY_DN7910_c0_g1_i2.p1  ORF type:complete len:1061 (+),score=211.59 TRINITY_DN7910_c0_g1_i2:71-3184(+)
MTQSSPGCRATPDLLLLQQTKDADAEFRRLSSELVQHVMQVHEQLQRAHKRCVDAALESVRASEDYAGPGGVPLNTRGDPTSHDHIALDVTPSMSGSQTMATGMDSRACTLKACSSDGLAAADEGSSGGCSPGKDQEASDVLMCARGPSCGLGWEPHAGTLPVVPNEREPIDTTVSGRPTDPCAPDMLGLPTSPGLSAVLSSNFVDPVSGATPETWRGWLAETANESRCVLSPVRPFRLWWDILVVCLMLYQLWAVPFTAFYMKDGEALNVFKTIDNVIMIFFIVDIILNFNTGYIQDGVVVMTRDKIILSYLKGWFWLDFIATYPWLELHGDVDEGGTVLSGIRGIRGVKILKAVRFVKLTRMLRVAASNKTTLQALTAYVDAMGSLKSWFLLGFKAAILSLLLAHGNACLFEAIRGDESDQSPKFGVGLERYWASWSRVYIMLFAGEHFEAATPEIAGFEAWIALERLLLGGAALAWLMCRTLGEDHKEAVQRRNFLAYLRGHHLGMQRLMKVHYHLMETDQLKKVRLGFEHLQKELPVEVRSAICMELWSDRLLSLGLILHIARCHDDLIRELSSCVCEEAFAAKQLVYCAGDPSYCAINVVKGMLFRLQTVVTAGSLETLGGDDPPIEPRYSGSLPDPHFGPGTWLGEKALVNAKLRRVASVTAQSLTTVMIVPADSFQAILQRLDLVDVHRRICKDYLWHGLCGRCGVLGHHFTAECPHSRPIRLKRKPSTKKPSIKKLATTASRVLSIKPQSRKEQSSNEMSFDLKEFLKRQHLLRVAPGLSKLGVKTLGALEALAMADASDELAMDLGEELCLTHSEKADLTSMEAIVAFQQEMEEYYAGRYLVQGSPTAGSHYIFLSHFKLEAGTEAALMRAELEALIMDTEDHPAQSFDVPVFLDSEDLHNLEELQERVRCSRFLVVLLTRGVLTRPWCLVEIVSAVAANVPVVLVSIDKPGNIFQFPDEAFYSRLLKGEIVDESGTQVLRESSISMENVEAALRHAFKHIAVPFSPHKPGGIRRAELTAIMKLCKEQ